MINTLKVSFQLDINYAINSFIYTLKHTPILKEFIPDTLYQNEKVKKIIRIFALCCTLFRMIGGKFLYLGFLYGMLSFLFPNTTGEIFIHTFFFFSIIGMFMNSHILSVGRKKYYAIILMGLDAKKYMTAYFLYDMVTTFLLNVLSLSIFCIGVFNLNFFLSLILASLVVFLKIIGEAVSVYYYQKTRTLLKTNTSLSLMILLMGIILAIGLPYLKITLTESTYFMLLPMIAFLAIIFCFYILGIKDYKLIYKRINTLQAIMNQENENAYSRQIAVEIRKKDYKIDEKKVKGKTGYDYFNTIFFLRHKVILSNSANIFAIFSFILCLILTIFLLQEPSYQSMVSNMIERHFAWIILIMYFVNRGAIVTQAMFYNCDRSMLTFNFYREPKTILNVFKERLKTMIKINLRPALVIATSTVFLLIICNHTFKISYLFALVSVLSLSIFFSVHHLVIYYLLQPYNIYMEMKSVSFSVISFFTYFICYLCKDIHLSFELFSILTIFITVLYIVCSLILVYKKSRETFKLK